MRGEQKLPAAVLDLTGVQHPFAEACGPRDLDAHDLVGGATAVIGEHETQALVEEAQVGPEFPGRGFLGLELDVRNPVRHREHRYAAPRILGAEHRSELVGVRIVAHPGPACPHLPGTEDAGLEAEGVGEHEGAGGRGVEVRVLVLG